VNDRHDAARTIGQDKLDAASSAPSNRIARHELAAPVKENGARQSIVDIDAQLDALDAFPVFDIEAAMPDAQRRVWT